MSPDPAPESPPETPPAPARTRRRRPAKKVEATAAEIETPPEAEIETPPAAEIETPPAADVEAKPKPAAKRRTPRKKAAPKSPKKSSPVARAPRLPRNLGEPRLRRSLSIPAFLDPMPIPEDAEGRVEFIVQPRPPRPSIAGKPEAVKQNADADVKSASVPWRVIMVAACALVTVFVVGMVLSR